MDRVAPDSQARPPRIERVMAPFNHFAHTEASGGIVLMICTVIALVWANSPWGDSYAALWNTKLTIGIGDGALSKELILWINDGLMAVFFFLVGLEIKREVLVGELADIRKAVLPFMAALGGMVFPALIYAGISAGGEAASGWGVPMATDIAFALGILSLLGDRVPPGLKVFLTAIAIVDDIGAVLVIALFYTSGVSMGYIAAAFVVFALMLALCRFGTRNTMPYMLLAVIMWFFFLKSGVHATIAGVLAAMAIPAKTRIRANDLYRVGTAQLEIFCGSQRHGESVLSNRDQQSALHTLEEACLRASTPLQRLEHGLHPWVAFLVMPVFALANAGIVIDGNIGNLLLHPASMGVLMGLVVGKQIGVTAMSLLTLKLGWARAPKGVGLRHFHGAAMLSGIGFTMSIFIANLAFPEGSTNDVASKIGILAASLIAGISGWAILRTAEPEE